MTNRELNQALLVLGLTVVSLVTLWVVLALVLGLFGVDLELSFD